MSPIAIDFLRRHHARPANRSRRPNAVTNLDFQVSSVIVALDESAHRPVIDRTWQQYSSWVRYWDGGTLDAPPWGRVFDRLDAHVSRLIRQLSDSGAFFDAA